MAQGDIRLDVHGNVRPLEKDIQKVSNKKLTLNLDTRGKFAQPLGKISGQLGEFEKSLEAVPDR